MYTYTHIYIYTHIHAFLCHFSNIALTVLCGAFKGKRLQNYMNTSIST